MVAATKLDLYKDNDARKHEIRATRHTLTNTNLDLTLSLNNQEIRIVNISESGILVESYVAIENLKVNDIAEAKLLFQKSEKIYSGECKVIWHEEGPSSHKYGVALSTSNLDDGILQAIEDVSEIKNEINAELSDYLKLPNEYIEFVYELRTYFNTVKEKVDQLEKQILIRGSSEKQSYLNAAELILGSEVVPKLRDYSVKLHQICTNRMGPAIKEKAKEFFRKELHEFYKDAAFTARAWEKPQGYAGDFIMMNQIYENKFEGVSLFSKLIHKWGINETSSLSVRYRRGYLKNKIESLGSDKPITIGSLACGPAKEMVDFLADLDPKASKNYTFVLMDQDKSALLSAKREINNIKFKRQLDCTTIFIPLSVRGVLECSETATEVSKIGFDLLYTAGLYDYLTQPVAKLLTNQIAEWVNPEGQLIVGNFHPNNPTHSISEFATEWSLIHRTEEQMMDLVDGVKSSDSRIHKDELEIDLFLEIRKNR